MDDAVNESFSLGQLRKRLQISLMGKRFLLVLDDLWICDLSKWIELKGFFTVAAISSKIIVTTCNHSVASLMGTIEPYTLKNLSDDECFSLIITYAFRDEEEADQHPNLKENWKANCQKMWRFFGLPTLPEEGQKRVEIFQRQRHIGHATKRP